MRIIVSNGFKKLADLNTFPPVPRTLPMSKEDSDVDPTGEEQHRRKKMKKKKKLYQLNRVVEDTSQE